MPVLMGGDRTGIRLVRPFNFIYWQAKSLVKERRRDPTTAYVLRRGRGCLGLWCGIYRDL